MIAPLELCGLGGSAEPQRFLVTSVRNLLGLHIATRLLVINVYVATLWELNLTALLLWVGLAGMLCLYVAPLLLRANLANMLWLHRATL